MRLQKPTIRPTTRLVPAVALSLSALVLAVGTQVGNAGARTTRSAGAKTAAAKLSCGQYDPTLAPDPSGILKTLPAAAQAAYTYDPYPVEGTPWSTFKGKKPPYKLAYVGEPYYGSAGWVSHVATEFNKLAAQYKKEGLVKSFQEFTPPIRRRPRRRSRSRHSSRCGERACRESSCFR